PKPVFAEYQRWQLELERQPVEFLGRRYYDLMAESRAALAAYLNADPDDLIYVDNATAGVNVVVRSLELGPGDEIVTTDHEYGACELTWQFLQESRGAIIKRAHIGLPLSTHEEIVDALWAQVTERTKVIYLSHITSFSALIFPVEEICRRAREAGIFTVIDGAHAPGQIPLDMQAIGADCYAGNLHKWLCAPKGAGFLFVRPEHQDRMMAVIVSWGWGEGRPEFGTTQFLRRNTWQGTRDPAAYLAVPAAIQFQAAHDWPAVRERCHELVVQARTRISNLTDLPPISPAGCDWFVQMATCPVRTKEIAALKAGLYDQYRVEIPCGEWQGMQYVRVSIQAYNDGADIDRLMEGLGRLL
ncbi:MAG TPA: aminotransferase class V-fold PLP-dependent enzyme, partial [Thermomicrobiales bacterium]|nr:aminotransferase class V-fold PLP-dependent enzyme [Thermomicrobiales bacterium]